MVRKKLAVAVAAIGALQANLASALGMGEFDLKSALNQPLNAEVKLHNTRDLDEAQVKISLAGREDFERAGVSRDYFLTGLKFEVELDDRGTGVIKITSRDPVIEPYLNFLIEARWPTGRLLREYTVLLDLPVFSESDSAPVSAATTTPSRPAAAPTAASVPVMTQGRSDRQTLSEGSLQAGEKYRVKQNETLWEIAAQSRPSRSVSVQQTMVSIQRLNRNAFIDGNINRLKAGYVLRLPTAAEITDISGSEAVKEVAAQNRAWKTGDTDVTDTGGAQLDATATSGGSDAGYAEDARLSIAATGDSDSGAAGAGGGEGTAALQDQLDSSMENLDAAKRENTELQGRLNDMESKIATLQRLLELKDDQLAALQGRAAEQQAGEDSTAADMDDGSDRDMAVAGSPSDESEMMAGDPATTPQEPAKAKPVPAEPSPPKPQPAPEQGLLDTWLANPLYLGGAGAFVLALAAVIVMRRRKALQEEEEQAEFGLFEEGGEDDALADAALDSEESYTGFDQPAEETPDSTDLLAAELEQEIAADNAEAVDEPEEPVPGVQSETGDAIAEADIYIAYGRYQQAIDLLTTAISQEPGRSDLRVKLLEVYMETRDKPDFQQQYMALQELGDDDAVGQVKEMLSSVDGVADWLDDLPGTVDSSFSDADMDAELIDDGDDSFDEIEEELDIDLDLDELGSTQELEAVSDEDLDLGDELDLDLDLEEPGEAAENATDVFEAVSSPEPEQGAEEDLDLDLGEPAESADLESDLDDLDLGDIDTIEEAGGEETRPAAEAAGEGGLDLDLDADSDLDMDLGDFDDTDLSELEAEFGDAGNETVSTDTGELDLNLDAAAALEDDVDLDDLDMSQGETVTLDTGDDAGPDSDLGDLDLSGDLEEAAGEAPGTTGEEYQWESSEAAPEPETPAPEPPAPSPGFDESVNPAPAGDDEFDFLADTDEVATKLDLARAYIDMGDTEGARDILDEVMQEGSEEQKQEASGLLERV